MTGFLVIKPDSNDKNKIAIKKEEILSLSISKSMNSYKVYIDIKNSNPLSETFNTLDEAEIRFNEIICALYI